MKSDFNYPLTTLKKKEYHLQDLEKHLTLLQKEYPFLKMGTIGMSEEKRPLYYVRLGEGKRKIHINASHHANEWVTSIILINSIEILCRLITLKDTSRSGELKGLMEKVTYDFVPMVNPDGIEICINGSQNGKEKEYLKKLNEGSENFSRWKANAKGIDLNRNYDAGFKEYQKISEKQVPSYAYYQGLYPECAAETKALAHLTRSREYDIALAYHTQGEVIYWNYKDILVANGLKYAKIFSEASGYVLDEPDYQAASAGYKDWFIETFRKPAYTIECGHGENPINVDQISEIVSRTFPILLLASKDL